MTIRGQRASQTRFFSIAIPDVFSFNFQAPANKKRSKRTQNDFEMVDRIASDKKVSTLPSSRDSKDAIINTPEDQNINEQLPATKVPPQVEPEEENNLPPFENGKHYFGRLNQFILMKRKI